MVWKVVLAWLLVYSCQAAKGPAFLVTFPAVIQAGSEAKMCASLFRPNETLSMLISLRDDGQKTLLLEERTTQTFHRCFSFQAPWVEVDSFQSIEVEVRGAAFSLMERSKVVFRHVDPLTFIRTDKPVYKRGQTVHFRVISMDVAFIPFDQVYDTVELVDPLGFRIGQWTNTSGTRGILQLSHPLSSEARLGVYSLSVWTGGRRADQSFKVMEYVLPKFEVKLDVPLEIFVVETERRLGACGKYTYGQPVAGKATMKLCREVYEYMRPSSKSPTLCLEASVEVNRTGCASHVFNISYLTPADNEALQDALTIRADMEEEGTGIILTEEASISLNYEMGRLVFIDTPTFYMLGSFLEGKVKATDFHNLPIPDMPVYLSVWSSGLPNLVHEFTTDGDGLAHFSLNTTEWTWGASLTAMPSQVDRYPRYKTPHFSNAYLYVSQYQPAPKPMPSSSNSLTIQPVEGVLLCGTSHLITVKYSFQWEAVKAKSVDLCVLGLSKGAIVCHGYIRLLLQEGQVTEGEVSFRLAVTSELAPMVQLLVYSLLPSEVLLAHSMDIPTEKCFKNKVSVKFSPLQAVPGEAGALRLTALPGSLCGLTAVDRSVLLLDPGKALTADMVFDMIPVQKASQVPYYMQETSECVAVRTKRDMQYGYQGFSEDALNLFKGLGLKMVTNLQLLPPECLNLRGEMYYRSRMQLFWPAMEFLVRESSQAMQLPEGKARTFFPETWLWDLVEVGDSGSALVPLTVPDTITTWETEVVCLSAEGFGLAPPSQLTVFQPFFLELTLPYSIVRGEQFELKATVFNYLPQCLMVIVTAAPSPQYDLLPSSDGLYTACVCDRRTFQWTLVPTMLGSVSLKVSAKAVPSKTKCDNRVVTVPGKGRIDTVVRTLLVKAEGEEKAVSHSWLLCPNGALLKEVVDLQLPADVVEGSARASVSVLGDLMGLALQNLDGLLVMPYGCGEQNIAVLAPDIYILEYLKATQQLTPAILKKATDFLKSGYQRELGYQLPSGAYSTFGYGEGSTWLTAFVTRSFGRARAFIYVDPRATDSANAWLLRQQKPDGCFKTVGTLYHNENMGGVHDDVTLTAYIIAALLELKMSVTEPVLEKSLSCLKASSNLTDVYTAALMAYTFSLSGDVDVRAMLLGQLHGLATAGGVLLQWSPPGTSALSVEMSAYVLLAVLTQPQLAAADLGYASKIVSWLVKQQNPQGGFRSTQDTVVALQALSLYATLTFDPVATSTVTVTSAGGETHHFSVDQSTKLLFQERVLKDVPGEYVIEAEGMGCLSVQVVLYYNVPPPADDSIFKVAAWTDGSCKDRLPETVHLTVQYKGRMSTTNMVIVDVKMLSGFVPDQDSVEKLRSSKLVERVDLEEDHVIMYLQEGMKILAECWVPHLGKNAYIKIYHKLPRDMLTRFQIDVTRQLPVKSLKPAVVKVYDYYHPSDQTVVEYSSACY